MDTYTEFVLPQFFSPQTRPFALYQVYKKRIRLIRNENSNYYLLFQGPMLVQENVTTPKKIVYLHHHLTRKHLLSVFPVIKQNVVMFVQKILIVKVLSYVLRVSALMFVTLLSIPALRLQSATCMNGGRMQPFVAVHFLPTVIPISETAVSDCLKFFHVYSSIEMMLLTSSYAVFKYIHFTNFHQITLTLGLGFQGVSLFYYYTCLTRIKLKTIET